MKINPHDRKANAFLNVVGTRSNQKRLMPSKTSKYGVGFGHSTQAGGDKSVNAKRANSAYRRDGSLTLNRQRSSTGQVAFSNATINVNRPRSAVQTSSLAQRNTQSTFIRPQTAKIPRTKKAPAPMS